MDSNADIFSQVYTIDDNPFLPPSFVENLKKEYAGTVFYDRYILGKWTLAEGLVYPMFGDSCIVQDIPDTGDYYISIDYGTHNPFSAGLWCVTKTEAVRIGEYYYCGREERKEKTPEEYYSEVKRLAGGRDIKCLIVDPSADAFIATVKKHHDFKVRGAVNDVLPGIQTTAEMIASGKLKIHESCEDAIREFGLYRWDEKAESDRVVKENDHAMDEIRYMVMTVLKKHFKEHRFVPELAR